MRTELHPTSFTPCVAAHCRPGLAGWACLVSFWFAAMFLLAACQPASRLASLPAAAPAAAETSGAPAAIAESACNPETPTVFAGWSYPGEEFDGVALTFSNSIKSRLPGASVQVEQLDNIGDINAAINQPMVAFVTTHGSPAGIGMSTVPTLPFTSLLLGQCDSTQQSRLRYLILSSCNVLAHGRNTGASDKPEYATPGDWEYRADSITGEAIDETDMRSIYVRWGERLGNGLRMVCGSSTVLPASIINNMWDEVGSKMALADAVIFGLSSGAVGVCMARGGRDFQASPLMIDTTFLAEANHFDNEPSPYYHLQYSKPIGIGSQNVHGVLVGHTQLERTVDELRTISAASPRCMPVGGAPDAEEMSRLQDVLNNSPTGRLITDYEAQYMDLPANGLSEEEALAQGVTEGELLDTAIGPAQAAVNQNNEVLGLADREVRSERASGIYELISILPVDRNQWDSEGIRVAYKNAIIEFPQLVPLSRFQVEDGTAGSDTQRQELETFYSAINDTYGEGEMQPADLRNPNADPFLPSDPLLPILGGSTLVQLNSDGTPILVHDKWQFLGLPTGINERVRTPLEAFQRSLILVHRRELAERFGMDGTLYSDEEFVKVLLASQGGGEQDLDLLWEEVLGEPDSLPYRLQSWNFGYASGWQNEGYRFWYIFRFMPDQEAHSGEDYPPKFVAVRGQMGEQCEIE